MRVERRLDDITGAKEGGYISLMVRDGDNGGVELGVIGFRSAGSGSVGNEDEGQLFFLILQIIQEAFKKNDHQL